MLLLLLPFKIENHFFAIHWNNMHELVCSSTNGET
jgi:hypothetical protein